MKFKLIIILISFAFSNHNDFDNEEIDHQLLLLMNNINIIYDKDSKTDFITTRQLSGSSLLYKQTVPSAVYVATNTSLGTGIIIDNDLILTNWHVVNGVEKVECVLYNSKYTNPNKISLEDFFQADVVAIDITRDLALLKTNKSLKNIAKLSNFYNISVADDVYAIGHPRGGGLWSFVDGTISNLIEDNEWIISLETANRFSHKANVIQTQTPINSGNSGGPLFNDKGEVIGVNTLKNAQGSENINFAIRVDEIKDFIKRAKENQYPKNNSSDKICKQTDMKNINEKYKSWYGQPISEAWECDRNLDQIPDEYYLYIDDGNREYKIKLVDHYFEGIFNIKWELDPTNNIYTKYLDQNNDGIFDHIKSGDGNYISINN